MALERADRIKETTTTTGTGTVNLGGAVTGFQTFVSAVSDGATVRYFIETTDLSEWEVGEGVFTDATPDTLSRVTVFASSNSGSLVDFSAGTKSVALSLVASDILGGQNSIITNETPSGDLDGTDVTYTLANTPITNSLALYLNGQRQTYTTDYTLSGSTITFVVPPISTDLIRADYLVAGAGSGNADTLDGKHGSYYASIAGTETLTNKTITSPVINQFGTASGLGAAWTSWTPSWTNLTIGNATVDAKYTQIGKTVHFRLSVILGSTSSVGTTPRFTLPVTIATYGGTQVSYFGNARYSDATGTTDYSGRVNTSGVLLIDTVSGTSVLPAGLTATVPFTWATSDEILVTGTYEAA